MKIKSIIAAALLVAGCGEVATTPAIVPQATGGNLGAGSVEMSYERRPSSRPAVNWTAAQQTAISRCNGWNFSSAQAYANDNLVCLATNSDGRCIQERVTRTYQCTN